MTPQELEAYDAMMADRDRWKAAHDNQVALKRIIAARPDLKDRAPMVEKLMDECDDLRRTNQGLQLTFDLRWKADQRAIKRWQAAHPGSELTWPDHADLVVWLMGQISPENVRALAQPGAQDSPNTTDDL